MSHFNIKPCPDYCALSYTWGSSDDLQEIIINGAQFQVRQNLYNFLRRLDDAPRIETSPQ
jgi:hypothetical protein